MKAKQCDVTIFKSIEVTIVKVVYEHEIPILEHIFGGGNVQRYAKHEWHTPKDKKYQVQNKDPVSHHVVEIGYDEEWARLQSAYGMKDGADNVSIVEYIYGRLEDGRLEKENNAKYSGQTIQEDSFDEEDSQPDMDYGSMTNRELKELLDDLSISYKPTATKAVLVDLLEKADKGELEVAN